MRTIDVEIDGKVYKLKELLAKDVDDMDWSDKKKASKIQTMLSTPMTEEEYDALTLRQKMILTKNINELNGIGKDF